MKEKKGTNHIIRASRMITNFVENLFKN